MRRILPALALVLSACGAAGPRPIAYGQESCAYCRMTVSDARYGAEAVTARGRAQTFDSVECLAAFAVVHSAEVRSLWVTEPTRPGELRPAETARFRRLAESGGGDRGPGHSVVVDSAGPLSWTDVLAQVERALQTAGREPSP